MKFRGIVLLVVLVSLFVAPFGHSFAQDDDLCDAVLILDARARASVAPNSGAYGWYVNLTDADVTLMGGSTEAAEFVEIHTMMVDDDDVMVMRPLVDGLTIPAGEVAQLAPGGYHVMLINLADVFEADTEFDLTLDFADFGTADLVVPIMDIETGMNMDMDMDDEDGMDMDDEDDMDMDDEDGMDMDDDMMGMDVSFDVVGSCDGLTGVQVDYMDDDDMMMLDLTLMFGEEMVMVSLPINSAADMMDMEMDDDEDSE